MLISCTICSDFLTPVSDNYVTPCGHIFHYNCLIKWFQEKKTCPQCRQKTNEKSIHKLFLNVEENKNVENDETLLFKVQNLEFEKMCKKKELQELKKKTTELEEKNAALREEVQVLEVNERGSKSIILALKDQVAYFKKKCKEVDQLKDETNKLKETLRNMDRVETVLEGTKEEVEEILRNERNMQTLALLAVTLKKSLIETERQKKEIDHKYKQLHSSANTYKKEAKAFQSMADELKTKLDNITSKYEIEKKVWQEEKQTIRDKISKKLDVANSNDSLNRIILESPIPIKIRQKSDYKPSPTTSEKVKAVLDSNSPYLPVKMNSVASFRIPKVNVDGLGNTCNKEDEFPSPKPKSPQKTNIKRKRALGTSSYKFKKLAPSATSNKLTNYFSEED